MRINDNCKRAVAIVKRFTMGKKINFELNWILSLLFDSCNEDSFREYLFITVRKQSCGKVMLSQASVWGFGISGPTSPPGQWSQVPSYPGDIQEVGHSVDRVSGVRVSRRGRVGYPGVYLR